MRTVLAFVHGAIAMEASEQAAGPETRAGGHNTSDGGDEFDYDTMIGRQLGYVLSGLEAELIASAWAGRATR